MRHVLPPNTSWADSRQILHLYVIDVKRIECLVNVASGWVIMTINNTWNYIILTGHIQSYLYVYLRTIRHTKIK